MIDLLELLLEVKVRSGLTTQAQADKELAAARRPVTSGSDQAFIDDLFDDLDF